MKKTPAQVLEAQAKFMAQRSEAASKWSADSEMPTPALHTAYRIHWRTDLRWRSSLIEFCGHIDYTAALTPESALEKFAGDFPARMPIRIESR